MTKIRLLTIILGFSTLANGYLSYKYVKLGNLNIANVRVADVASEIALSCLDYVEKTAKEVGECRKSTQN